MIYECFPNTPQAWTAPTRDRAAADLGYTDDLGNPVDDDGNRVPLKEQDA